MFLSKPGASSFPSTVYVFPLLVTPVAKIKQFILSTKKFFIKGNPIFL
jgi:hypothetical protein